MTGYGYDSITIGTMSFTVEMKSVNHRYSEVVVRVPRAWSRAEDRLRKLVQSQVKRGRVEVVVAAERSEDADWEANLDRSLAAAYVGAAERLASEFGGRISGTLTAAELLAMPGVFAVREGAMPEDAEDRLLDCAARALGQLVEMRETEGRFLAADASARLRSVAEALEAMRAAAPAAAAELRQRLSERVKELLGGPEPIDEARLAAEIVYYAERSAIDEELTRLASHVAQFSSLLESEEPVGRRLDFLLQEMNREINTIGSKSNHASFTAIVVDMKSELEKLREQTQNIE